jgi:hypothetical protein
MEAETALVRGLRDPRPGRRLLGDGEAIRVLLAHGAVQRAKELDGLQVLATAEEIGQPFARLAAVVAVEHRGDGVHAQTVDVELLEPVERVRHQEVAHLVAPKVEDEGAPIGVLSDAGIAVLVEGLPIEAAQGEVVAGEVGGDPVENDADARLVAAVHEGAEVVRLAVAGRGSVVAAHLIAPRAVEGELGHRQKLDVGEAESLRVLHQARSDLPVAERPVALFGNPAPRPQVHLVDGHGLVVQVLPAPPFEPCTVLPAVLAGRHPRGRSGRRLHREGERIGLQPDPAVPGLDLVLVGVSRDRARHEELEHSGAAPITHGKKPPVPMTEISHHAHPPGVGRPHRERHTVDSVDPARMRSEQVPETPVLPLSEQVQVELADRAGKAVGVLLLPRMPVVRSESQAIAGALRGATRNKGSEEARPSGVFHEVVPAPRQEHLGVPSGVMEGAHDPPFAALTHGAMRPEDPLGLRQVARRQGCGLRRGHRPHRRLASPPSPLGHAGPT